MFSTFETLPDEILMMIFKYSDGDVINLFETFLGLNQRLNEILLDKRLHLFTDHLNIPTRNDYYHSDLFQQISRQLLSINTSVNKEKLGQLLQPLITFHLEQRYIQLGIEFELSFQTLQSIRRQLTNDQIARVDEQLQIQFHRSYETSVTLECMARIQILVLIEGARLECENYELVGFNFCKAVNDLFLAHINDIPSKSSISMNSYLKLFQTLILSNPSILNNRDYVGNGGCNVIYFLVYTLYRLRGFYRSNCSMPVNMIYYRALVDFFLFAIQGQKRIFEDERAIQRIMFDILESIPEMPNDLFIQTAQRVILKIIVEEYLMRATRPWNEYDQYTFKKILKRLLDNRRLDVLNYIYPYFRSQDFFNESNHIRECLDIMTSHRSGREFLSQIIDNRSLDFLCSNQSLIFMLLDKKERKLIKKVLKLSPHLIDQLDEDGNDPLLYISLKVRGCRHRIIENLIQIGSTMQRRNVRGETFKEILQLQRNHKLLKTLIEHEIIPNDIL